MILALLCSAQELQGGGGVPDELADIDFDALATELELGADFPSAGLLS